MDETTEQPVRSLLAGPDTLYFSFEVSVSESMLAALDVEKATAFAGKPLTPWGVDQVLQHQDHRDLPGGLQEPSGTGTARQILADQRSEAPPAWHREAHVQS